jgi:hypothetical protein
LEEGMRLAADGTQMDTDAEVFELTTERQRENFTEGNEENEG